MKVTKSAIYRLEVEAACGCKAAREYEDEGCKKSKDEPSFKPCTGHQGEIGEMMKEVLVQVVDKDAAEMKIPERIHPRSQHHAPTGDDAAKSSPEEEAAPARTLRTTGSTGAVRGPSVVPPRSAPGSHRPTGGGGSGASPFRRTEGGAKLSANAAAALAGTSKVAARLPASPLSIDIGDTVEEDERVTKLLQITGFDTDDDGEDTLDLD